MKKKIIHPAAIFLLLSIVFGNSGLPVSAVAWAETAASSIQYFTWTEYPSPVTTTLNSVDMVSISDGWAAGENGTVLHYNGSAWTVASAPITETTGLFSVSMSSAVNGWAVGAERIGPFGNVLLRWNGSQWIATDLPTLPFPAWPVYWTDVWVTNDTNAWLSGGIIVCAPDSGSGCHPEASVGAIAHWDGSSWISTRHDDVFLSAISMNSDSDGWAVGTRFDSLTQPVQSVILHWEGSFWNSSAHLVTEYPGGTHQFTLEEVSAHSATNAWTAVTGQNKLLHWDGTAWSQVDSPVRGKPSIAVVANDDAWAAGGEGDIGHWDGSAWTSVPSPVTENLSSISMVSAHEGWIVGENGMILHGVDLRYYFPSIAR